MLSFAIKTFELVKKFWKRHQLRTRQDLNRPSDFYLISMMYAHTNLLLMEQMFCTTWSSTSSGVASQCSVQNSNWLKSAYRWSKCLKSAISLLLKSKTRWNRTHRKLNAKILQMARALSRDKHQLHPTCLVENVPNNTFHVAPLTPKICLDHGRSVSYGKHCTWRF